eukprot:CAMPEP_0184719118 /NCGR_PEP_ID=MMETSP0314-20130426/8123_1 /TAXON_ID=38298 /ORGANISM="Rhodella maculata, Strain CCMP 736" /LENGTH=209 /DNA_ID=CAMNT_0027182965 /DNA_START=79 /DNA_END=708 /DNA_ORIENTATION=-
MFAFVSAFTPALGARATAPITTSRPAPTVTMMAKSKAIPMLEAPKALDGSMVGDVGFDPLGFSNMFPIEWLREAEIKHARVCMLAALGIIVSEVYRFPFYSGAPKLATEAHDYFVKFGSLNQVLTFAGFFEVIGFMAIVQTMKGSGRRPGDFGFDPLKMASTEEKFKKMQLSELKNGRLAMIAVGGMIHQMWLTNMGVVEQLTHGKFLP